MLSSAKGGGGVFLPYYRKSHDIDGSTEGAQTNYQMKITVHYGSGADSGEDVYLNSRCRTDFGDVRFADSGLNKLTYYLESKVDGNYAIFWVKVSNIPASPSSAKIYVYYGKLTEVSESVAENVMFVVVGQLPEPYETSWWSLGYPYGEYFNNVYWLPNYKTISRWWKLRQITGTCKVKFLTWHTIDATHFHLCGKSVEKNIVTGINTFNDINIKAEGHLARAFIGFIVTANYGYFRSGPAPTYGTDRGDPGEPNVCDTWLIPGYEVNRITSIQACFRRYAEPEPSHGAWGSEEKTGWPW